MTELQRVARKNIENAFGLGVPQQPKPPLLEFRLRINLDKHTQTPKQVADALTLVAAQLYGISSFDGDTCPVRNDDGIRIGSWMHNNSLNGVSA